MALNNVLFNIVALSARCCAESAGQFGDGEIGERTKPGFAIGVDKLTGKTMRSGWRATKLGWPLAALLTLATLSGAAMASEKVTLIVGGAEKIIYLPASLAQRLGYYREQDLSVDLQSELGGNEAEDALLAGAADGVIGFYDHTIELQAKGKFVESIIVIGQAPGEAEIVATRLADKVIRSADFSGLTFGVTGLGSSTVTLAQYLAMRQGASLRDLTLVPAGAGDTFITALKDGRIDLGITSEPTVSRLLKLGVGQVVVDLRTPEAARAALGGTYPAACLYVQSSWVQQHHDTARHLASALVKALVFINTHDAAQIAALVPESYYAGDKALYIDALARAKPGFTPDGRMPPDGPATVLGVLEDVSRSSREKNIDLSRTYTDEFVNAAQN